MNRKPLGSTMNLAKTIDGFLSYKAAEGLTARTLDSYERQMKKWLEYQGDVPIGTIKSKTIIDYFNWLRNEYVPRRYNGKVHPLSPKTIRNVWITFSAFFKWAHIELEIPNPMVDVPAPKYKLAPVHAFTKDEIEKLLKACAYSREAKTLDRKKFAMKRPTANRDQAVILTLLDTGLRASELCMLQIKNIDLKTGRVEIMHGVIGGAKGGKGRTVYIGKSTKRALWRYLAERDDGENPDAPVFVGIRDRPMNPNSLRHLIVSIAKRAGVKDAYPHKFVFPTHVGVSRKLLLSYSPPYVFPEYAASTT